MFDEIVICFQQSIGQIDRNNLYRLAVRPVRTCCWRAATWLPALCGGRVVPGMLCTSSLFEQINFACTLDANKFQLIAFCVLVCRSHALVLGALAVCAMLAAVCWIAGYGHCRYSIDFVINLRNLIML